MHDPNLPLKSLLFLPSSTSTAKISRLSNGTSFILDLEDSVAHDQKDGQRTRVRNILATGIFRDLGLLIRVNGLNDTQSLEQDLAACLHTHVDALVIPMIVSASDVERIDKLLGLAEERLGLEPGGIALVPLLERPAAILNAHAIARASPRSIALSFGHADFLLELGAEASDDTLQMPRSMVVMAAKASGLRAIASPCTNLYDEEVHDAEYQRMKRMGFDGVYTLNPRQMHRALDVFSPSAQEIEEAQEIINAVESQGVVAVLNGIMIGPPMLKRARKILAECQGGRTAC